MSVSAGTDTYGRVKSVGGIPIVTKFAMLQFIPLYPLQSYFYAGAGRTRYSGIPFVMSTQTSAIHGIPLCQLDGTSVVMAYVRGAFGALAIIGFIAIVPLIMYLTGERLDDLAMTAMYILIGCFVGGLVGGALSYAIPLTPRRERMIRSYCGELLGIAVDPARVAPQFATAMDQYARQILTQGIRGQPRLALIQQLISCRSNIARNANTANMEQQSDVIMNRLDQQQSTAVRNMAV